MKPGDRVREVARDLDFGRATNGPRLGTVVRVLERTGIVRVRWDEHEGGKLVERLVAMGSVEVVDGS